MIDRFPKPLAQQFGIIHHKALNTRENLDASLALAKKYNDQLHVFEGDLCWYFDEKIQKYSYYFFHPLYGFDRLSQKQVEARNKIGAVLTLQNAINEVPDNVLVIIELKLGKGNLCDSMAQLMPKLQQGFAGRFWVDTFSIKQLKATRSIDPTIPISIHTERIIGKRLWTMVPDWPMLYSTKISSLNWLDGFSIRHWKNFRSLDKAVAHLRAVLTTPPALFISRIFTPEKLEHAFKLGAHGGYFEIKDIEGFMPTIRARTTTPP